MVMAPYFDKSGRKKGAWNVDEDKKLRTYIERYGHYNWRELPKLAGLSRCGKSCRLRWKNYLSPNVKLGNFSKEEEGVIVALHNKLGNKWSRIAERLPGRSDNEIKNHWHAHLKTMSKDESRIGSSKLANKSSHKASPGVEITLPTTVPVSSQLPSTSATSSCSLSDCINNGVSSSHVAFEYMNLEGDFWTQPFLLDNNSSTIYQTDTFLLLPIWI